MENNLLVLPLLLSFTLPVAFYALRRSASWQLSAGVFTSSVVFLLLCGLITPVLRGAVPEVVLSQVLPGVSLALRVDAFGLIFALVASFLWILANLYSFGYLTALSEQGLTRFFSFFSLAIFATLGAAFSANLFTLYVFYELLSLSTWPLVAHHRDEQARNGARRYLIFLLGSSVGLLLPAMIIAYSSGAALDFAQPSVSPDLLEGWKGFAILLMFLFGFAKAALMPFHSWLPNAMVAPTPVSALLHAVAVVKVGVFGIFRLVTGVLGVDLLSITSWGDVSASTLIVTLAATTMLLSCVLAFNQQTLKGLLAYSTIGQLAFIILGVGLLSESSLFSGSIHIAFHAFGKITLFFCAGAIYVFTGYKKLSQLDGIACRMPLTMAAFVIGAATVIGLPPTAGFISKWYLVEGCLQAGQTFALVSIALTTLMKIGYFGPLIFRAYYLPPADRELVERRGSVFCIFPPMVTALMCLALMFEWHPILSLAELGISKLF